jgi:hypothetical protein
MSPKTFGAGIACGVCGARPWPTDAGVRETFSLLRLGPTGRPAESPSPGEWRCEQHLIPEQDMPAKRAPRAAPAEALADFGDVIETELGHLREEIADGGRGEAMSALAACRQEIERGLASLRKAVQP